MLVPSEFPAATAVAGESGSGKTTMARLLLGFIEPTGGQILYKGVDITRMSKAQRQEYRREVQPIFQDPFEVYNPFYVVDHVLTTPLRNFGIYQEKGEAQRRIAESLEMVGLRPQETLGRYPHELSGGQRQRIMVARALLLRPRVILADEPVSMVDASLRATILDELRHLNTEFGISLLYITHDLTTAYQICDNIVVLYQGSVAEAGSVEKVIHEPQHPYTQLLVSSIPQPDRSRSWGDGRDPGVGSDRGSQVARMQLRAAMPTCVQSLLERGTTALSGRRLERVTHESLRSNRRASAGSRRHRKRSREWTSLVASDCTARHGRRRQRSICGAIAESPSSALDVEERAAPTATDLGAMPRACSTSASRDGASSLA